MGIGWSLDDPQQELKPPEVLFCHESGAVLEDLPK
jgi:hypothetical protein